MIKIDNLLAEIQKATGCPYLSDLQFNDFSFNDKVKENIMRIPDDAYPLEAWNQAVTYILREPCCFQTVLEAKKMILKAR